jgi:hypothetical protein
MVPLRLLIERMNGANGGKALFTAYLRLNRDTS